RARELRRTGPLADRGQREAHRQPRRAPGRNENRWSGASEEDSARSQNRFPPAAHVQTDGLCPRPGPASGGFVHGRSDREPTRGAGVPLPRVDPGNRPQRAVSLPGGYNGRQGRAEVDPMIFRNAPLSRRTMLRGAGASLALPWLEAMMPSGARAATRAPVRMAILYMPNGVREDMWTPEGEGRNFTLSPTLQPLADLKSELIVATNLWNQSAKGGEGHYIKTAGYLTCTTVSKTLGVDLNCHGISLDQLAAQKAGNQTPIPSLELGIAPVTTGVDTNVGYTRVYGSHISWSGPTSPVAKELNPRFVYERLLRCTKPQPNSAKDDLLLLDEVQADAKLLRDKLGAADRQRLDEYLTGIRSVEERVGRAGKARQ